MSKSIDIVQRRAGDLKLDFGNPRKIKSQRKKDLEKSLETYGDFDIIVINEDNQVIGGNQRVKIYQDTDPDKIVDCKMLVGYTVQEQKVVNVKLNTHAGDWDLDIGYGAVDASAVPWGYSGEFEFKGTSGGMPWFNKSAYKSRFLEEVYHNCDLDVVLHELLVNRIILKPKYLCTHGGTDTNAGGNSSKTRKDQEACAELMKNKWGKYFDYDFKSNKPFIKVKR